MLTIDNFILILFQIGFHEMEEHEIVFDSFEEKTKYRNGIKRFLIKDKNSFTIDFSCDEALFFVDNEKSTYLIRLSLDDMKGIFQALNDEYSKELRILKIRNILNDGE